jgi:YqiJ-like protein
MAATAFINAVAWLNVGGVPLLVFIVVILGMFSITGFLIQDVARAVAGPLPLIAAVPLACAVSVPLVRGTSRLVSRIIPKDETYAVKLDDLVGRVGNVSVGPLDQGLPGRVRVKDAHDNWHTVTAAAAPNAPPLPVGASVLLVDRSDGHFIAIAAPEES